MAVWWWIKTKKPPSGAAGGRPPAPVKASPVAGVCGLAGVVLAIVGETLWERDFGPYLVAAGAALVIFAIVAALRARKVR